MKKLLLIFLGLSVLGLDGMAQRGKGRGGSHPHVEQRHHDRKQPPHGKANGHYKHKSKHNDKHKHHDKHYRAPTVVRHGSHQSHHRVVVRHRPGIRYVRTVTVAPRAYVSVNIGHHQHVRRRVLHPEEIDIIALDMSREYYDEIRLDIAKSGLRRDMVYAEDVAYLINQLDFEEHRLELAKFAYSRTIDKRNYDFVYKTLDYHASRRDLDRYIHRW